MESVYIETTIISYLVARPSRDLIVAAHQQVTVDWWDRRRPSFECYVSPVVIDEVSAGDPSEVQKRLKIADGLTVLAATTKARQLAESIMKSGILPPKAARDAAHVALAAVHGIEYLLTWNCRHLANAHISHRISLLCDAAGLQIPIICTPDQLMEETDDVI